MVNWVELNDKQFQESIMLNDNIDFDELENAIKRIKLNTSAVINNILNEILRRYII